VKRCIVKGCTNQSDQGMFIGEICIPCYKMITTGDASKPSTNFIHQIYLKKEQWKDKACNVSRRK
jgi:hypothetical protein